MNEICGVYVNRCVQLVVNIITITLLGVKVGNRKINSNIDPLQTGNIVVT